MTRVLHVTKNQEYPSFYRPVCIVGCDGTLNSNSTISPSQTLISSSVEQVNTQFGYRRFGSYICLCLNRHIISFYVLDSSCQPFFLFYFFFDVLPVNSQDFTFFFLFNGKVLKIVIYI